MDPRNEVLQPTKYSFKDFEHSALIDFLSAGFSGLVSKSVLYPMESIQRILSERSDYKAFRRRDAYFSAAPKIFKEGGIATIFQNFIPAVVRTSIHFGADLALFFQIKYTMYPRETMSRKDIPAKGNIMSGLLASLGSYAIVTPLLEMQNQDKGIVKTSNINDVIKSANLANCFKYWKYDVPYVLLARGLLIGLHETKFKGQYYRMRGNVPYFLRFLDAYALALFSGFVSYPFWHAKKRVIEFIKKQPEVGPDVLNEVAKKEGSRVFLKGISSLFTTQVSVAVSLTLFYALLEQRKDMV